MMFKKNSTPTYGLEKKNYISISLQTVPTLHATNKSVAKSKHKKKQKPKKKKRTSVDAVDEDIDVDSLFSNVWTKKVNTHVRKKPKLDAKRIAQIEKDIDIKSEISESGTKKLSSEGEKNKNEKALLSGEEVNEYLAKIHAIVYKHFFPPANTEGQEVKAVIELSPLGKMLDFRVLNYSVSEALNEEADRIKERLRGVLFPKNPQARSERIVIILKPENKE